MDTERREKDGMFPEKIIHICRPELFRGFGVQYSMDNVTADILLAKRIAEGDYVAFRLAYDKYAGILYSVAMKFLKDESLASNAVQTVFVRLWENRSRIAVNISLRNYLYTSVKHFVMNYMRDRNSELRRNYRYAQMLEENRGDLENKIEKEERFRKIADATEKLPEQQARVVRLKSSGLSNEEIARELGITVSTVKYHYNEALQRLRRFVNAIAAFVIINCLW